MTDAKVLPVSSTRKNTTGVRPLRIVRDVILFMALAFLHQLSAHLAIIGREEEWKEVVLGLTNLWSALFSFTLIGYMTLERRWTHLCYVAGVIAIIDLVSFAIAGYSVSEWLFALTALSVLVAIGGFAAGMLRRIPAPDGSDVTDSSAILTKTDSQVALPTARVISHANDMQSE